MQYGQNGYLKRRLPHRHYINYQSKGICSIDLGKTTKIGNFTIDRLVQGNWTSENDFTPCRYTLGWSITDGNKEKTVITIKAHNTDDLNRQITSFLNELCQYHSLEDCLNTSTLADKTQWNSQDTAEKICQLAKVIELYKKYKLINPALAIVRDMEALIEERLKQIIKKV
ncbi:MAG: hypothetical protein K2N05_03935 [Muribaculaceae bacterium]|nr:hypothetical protein [Muribaculaceae bacterium]